MSHIDMMHKLSDQIIGLKALNAELLAALIQMEGWAGDFANRLLAISPFDIHPAGPFPKDIAIARAVIAKAKELDQ